MHEPIKCPGVIRTNTIGQSPLIRLSADSELGVGKSRIYLSNCGMGGRIARPGQRFSDARPQTLLAALSTGNHVIPVRRR
jgi:hypothetical protein